MVSSRSGCCNICRHNRYAAADLHKPIVWNPASGGLFGLLLAFAMVFPKRTIVLLIPPIPMPAWLFVTLYAGIELYLGVTGTLEGIAHFAHLGGLVGGFAVLMHWRAQYARRLRSPER